MRLFIVPPAVGCGCRIIATGARGRGAGEKRPSRRPSGPGKMTSGIEPADKKWGRMRTRGSCALYRHDAPRRNHCEPEPDLADRLYLDHAATTPMLDAARAAVAEGMTRWANPSSPHAEGRAARAAL